MDIQTLILIGMFLALIAFCLTLYHAAHGNERKAVEQGARIVLDSLQRQGVIAPAGDAPVAEALNLGEEDYAPVTEEKVLPDVIVARNERMARQMGERINEDLMKAMDEAQRQ